jgi:hypothetical protein
LSLHHQFLAARNPPVPHRHSSEIRTAAEAIAIFQRIAQHCVSVLARKTNRKPPVKSRNPVARSPIERSSSDIGADNLRVTLERTTAEMDKLSPPPPGIERQYFDGPLGLRTRSRKRERELAVENLERLAANRDYPTARLTLIWLWQCDEVIQAVNEDSKSDLEAELPKIKQTLSLF